MLLAPVPLLLELLALVHAAPVLLAMCFKHQCKKHIASDTIGYGINGMSIGYSGIVLRMHCPKISTGQEKLALTGRHGWHVFATLRKTGSRAAERPPTGKPKLSRVTSGCGEDIIPLSRVRETTKNGGYMGVA